MIQHDRIISINLLRHKEGDNLIYDDKHGLNGGGTPLAGTNISRQTAHIGDVIERGELLAALHLSQHHMQNITAADNIGSVGNNARASISHHQRSHTRVKAITVAVAALTAKLNQTRSFRISQHHVPALEYCLTDIGHHHLRLTRTRTTKSKRVRVLALDGEGHVLAGGKVRADDESEGVFVDSAAPADICRHTIVEITIRLYR